MRRRTGKVGTIPQRVAPSCSRHISQLHFSDGLDVVSVLVVTLLSIEMSSMQHSDRVCHLSSTEVVLTCWLGTKQEQREGHGRGREAGRGRGKLRRWTGGRESGGQGKEGEMERRESIGKCTWTGWTKSKCEDVEGVGVTWAARGC